MNVEQLDSLAAAWTVLARLIAAAPDETTLENMRCEAMLATWPLTESPQTEQGVARLLESGQIGEQYQEIKDDHFHLFVGPGSVLAPPWESVYRSEERLLFEEETIQVRQFYRRFGLQAPKLNREPDDHISLELDFCATLLIRALDAIDEDDLEKSEGYQQAHADFCTEHLFVWADEFFQLVIDNAKTSFWQGVGLLGSGALSQAKQLLTSADTSENQ